MCFTGGEDEDILRVWPAGIHIHELIVAKVFDTLIKLSSVPHIKLFQIFCAFWTSIIENGLYASGMADDSVVSVLEQVRSDLV